MLFISRRVFCVLRKGGPRGPLVELKYAVGDTDDDVESIVDRNSLEMCAIQYKMEIGGVEVDRTGRFVIESMPYQPVETMTVLQTKTSVLHHVDVTVYEGAITSIAWYPDAMKAPVTLRLSDFGSRCGDCILWDNLGSKHSVTLIVDDKISISYNTFRPEIDNVSIIFDGGLGVVFDLRELTREETADIIYSSVARYRDGSFDNILDSDERKYRMREKYYDWAG